jgi:hypothetical protein
MSIYIKLPLRAEDEPTMRMSRQEIWDALAICERATQRAIKVVSSGKMKAAALGRPE